MVLFSFSLSFFMSSSVFATKKNSEINVLNYVYRQGESFFISKLWGISILILLILYLLWLFIIKYINRIRFSPKSSSFYIEDLYLSCRFDAYPANYRANNSSEREKVEQTGFIKGLGLTGGAIISSLYIEKNSIIKLYLSSLPKYPDESSEVIGIVGQCSKLSDYKDSYLLTVVFNIDSVSLSTPKLSKYLGQYYKQ